MEKKLYKYLLVFGGIIVFIMLVLFISFSLSGGKKYKYEDVEKILVNAGKKYAKDHPAVYPINVGSSYVISSSVLINNGYMKEFDSYVKNDDVNCTGSVEIFHASLDSFDFVPTFRCGNKYQKVKLADKVIEDNEYGVIEGSGLYERVDGNFVLKEEDFANGDNYTTLEYVFRGDEVNNYVKIDDMYFRIVSIDDQNNLLLIYNGSAKTAYSWDDRYNDEFKKNQGINIYEQNGIKSRAMENAESFYDGDLVLYDKVVFSNKIKYITTPMSLCVETKKESDTNLNGKTECEKTLDNQNIGYLAAYQYQSASLDNECKSTTSKNCGNYNYLSQFNDNWWLLTGNKEISNECYVVARNYISSSICSAKSTLRPVILLGARALYNDGDGTLDNPYTIVSYVEEDV